MWLTIVYNSPPAPQRVRFAPQNRLLESAECKVKLMTEYLLEQARYSRAFLFLQGSNRLAYLFLNHYDKYAENEVLTLQADRQELADYTGLCLKTITRSVKKFKEQGLITKEGSSIIITKKQYRKLREVVSMILIED